LENLRIVTRILVDASAAIQHLHSQHIVHRDIAARNFLIGHTNRAVICDFGLARHLTSTFYQSDGMAVRYHVCGYDEPQPIKWSAPESLCRCVQSKMTDVYMFGIFMFEVVARSDPYPGLDPVRDVAPAVCDLSRVFRPTIPAYAPLDLVGIMRDCWAADPIQRPTIERVNARLTRYLETLNEVEHLRDAYSPFNPEGLHSAGPVVEHGDAVREPDPETLYKTNLFLKLPEHIGRSQVFNVYGPLDHTKKKHKKNDEDGSKSTASSHASGLTSVLSSQSSRLHLLHQGGNSEVVDVNHSTLETLGESRAEGMEMKSVPHRL